MDKKKSLCVERETYVKNDKTYFSYFIKGTVRGREVRVGVMPPDVGGYQVLDIVFGSDMKVDLEVKPFEMKTNDGEIIKGNTFAVVSKDEDGTEYTCPVKPARRSDKALLEMLLKK